MSEKIMELVDKDDPVLHTPTERVKTADLEEVAKLYDPMRAIIKQGKAKGFAISANQVGIAKAFFVVYRGFLPQAPDRMFINPRLVEGSEETKTMTEGCMSNPKAGEQKVERCQWVEIEYQDTKGMHKTWLASGIASQVVQHELDHLSGKVVWKTKKQLDN